MFGLRYLRYPYYTGQFIMIVLALHLLLSSSLLAIGLPLGAAALPVSAIIAFLLVWRACKLSLCDTIVVFVCAVLVTVLCSVICGMTFDPSYDGNAYHKVAVGLLKHGWIPPMQSDEMVTSLGISPAPFIWIIHYCKQPWYFGASIYNIANNIECGKSYTMVAMIAAAAIAYSVGMRATNRRSAGLVFAGVSALNPIAISQCTTYYIDGYLQVVLWILVVLSYASYAGLFPEDSRITKLAIASTMIVVGNIKFTGLVFGGAYCIVFFLVSSVRTWKRLGRSQAQPKIVRLFVQYLVLAIVTVFLGGMQTYLPNVLVKGNPFWPLAGEGKVDIMTSQTPPAILHTGRLRNLLCSFFCEANNSNQASGYVGLALRTPFTVSTADAQIARTSCDIRIGGFGAFFGIVFVIASIILLVRMLNAARKGRLGSAALPIALVLLSAVFCCVIRESWWARYAPYLYFIPLYAFMALCRFPCFDEKGRDRYVCALMLGSLLMLNSWQMAAYPVNTIRQSRGIAKELQQLNGKDVQVTFGYAEGVAFNLYDNGCHLVATDSLDNGKPFYYKKLRIAETSR